MTARLTSCHRAGEQDPGMVFSLVLGLQGRDGPSAPTEHTLLQGSAPRAAGLCKLKYRTPSWL